MWRWKVGETRVDRRVARMAVAAASPATERPAKAITLLGDERLLLTAATLFRLACLESRGRPSRAASRLFLDVAFTAALPHLLKGMIAQERPDRCEVRGNRHGIPHSGRAFDAFPSGHAMHLGALASALGEIAPSWRPLSWSICAGIAASRVLILAHWLSDVAIGFGIGIVVDKFLARPLAASAAPRGDRFTLDRARRPGAEPSPPCRSVR